MCKFAPLCEIADSRWSRGPPRPCFCPTPHVGGVRRAFDASGQRPGLLCRTRFVTANQAEYLHGGEALMNQHTKSVAITGCMAAIVLLTCGAKRSWADATMVHVDYSSVAVGYHASGASSGVFSVSDTSG